MARSHHSYIPFPAYRPNENYVIEHGPCRGLVCHEADVETLTGRFEKLPYRFRGAIARQYTRQYKKKGRRLANYLVVDSLNRLPKTACRLAADDGELVDYSKARAESASRVINRGLGDQALVQWFLTDQESRFKVDVPNPEKKGAPKELTIESALERLKDPLWWRRAIRKSQGRTVEQAARDFDLVHKRAGIYSSEETLHRRKGQKCRNRQMLEEIMAINEEGDEYTLAQLSDLGTSNPEIRRGELMLRIDGFDKVAVEANHSRDFWTLTCPSYFHSHLSKSSERNPKYKGATPRDAQKWLSKVWARVRAKLDRLGIKLYGFRVAEPHHDGCTHWHLLVFSDSRESGIEARRVMLDYASKEDGEGRWMLSNDLSCSEFDTARMSAKWIYDGTRAAGYLAKYISKNICGHSVGKDLLGDDINTGMERVDAWAACWGIRQFQQIGGPPVTVWRELRRIADQEHSGILEKATVCADSPDWAGFVQVMGGPMVKRDDLPIRPAYLQEIKTDTGELPVNKYGELAAGRIVGVREMVGQVGGLYLNQIYHLTRFNNWSFEHGQKDEDQEGNKTENLHLLGPGVDELQNARKGREKSKKHEGHSLQPHNGVGVGGIAFNWDRQQKKRDIEPAPWSERGMWFGNPVNWKKSTGAAGVAPWSSVNNCTGLGGESLMYDSDDIHQYRQLAARPPD